MYHYTNFEAKWWPWGGGNLSLECHSWRGMNICLICEASLNKSKLCTCVVQEFYVQVNWSLRQMKRARDPLCWCPRWRRRLSGTDWRVSGPSHGTSGWRAVPLSWLLSLWTTAWWPPSWRWSWFAGRGLGRRCASAEYCCPLPALRFSQVPLQKNDKLVSIFLILIWARNEL